MLIVNTNRINNLNTRINELVGQGINKSLAKTLATTEQTFDADKEILENKQKQIEIKRHSLFSKKVGRLLAGGWGWGGP